jgi:hypothetical protein
MATLYEDTIENVLQIISDYRGESTTDTSARRIRSVSRQEQALAKRKLFKLFVLPNQTASGDGTNDYTIGSATYPMRLNGLSEVFVGGTTADKQYQIVDYHKYKELYNQNNSDKLVYLWYDVVNKLWKMHINPSPTASDTITYTYYWIPPKKTTTAEYVYCVDMEALARYANAEIYDGDDEPEIAQQERQIGEQILDDAIGEDNRPNVNQLYKFEAIENMNQSRGIGSY